MRRSRGAVQCPRVGQALLQPADCAPSHLHRASSLQKWDPKPLGEKEKTKAFLYVHLLNKNSFMTIQYSLVISIEKIISLYIQKYRFEQYENNQDKYHEKLVLQRKVAGEGSTEGSVRLCLLSGNQREQMPWLPHIIGNAQGQTWESREAHPWWQCQVGQDGKHSTANNTN